MTSLNVGELQLECKSVPVVTSAVSKLKFVSVFIKIMDAQDLGNHVEIFAGFLGSGKGGVKIRSNAIVAAEV